MKQKKIFSYVKRALMLAVVGVVFGVLIYNINAKFILNDAMPMPFGVGCSVVLSGSMEPELSVNDLIIVKKTDDFRERQVVVYQRGKSLTVHRIISIDGGEIVTQGDANNKADDAITKEMIKGEVVFAVPFAGLIIGILQEPAVMAVLLVAAVVLMERSFKKEKSEEQEELDSIRKEIEQLKNNKE